MTTQPGGFRRALRGAQWTALKLVLPAALGVFAATRIHNALYPPSLIDLAPKYAGEGPIQMKIRLPGLDAALPEPVLVCGKEGRATLLYVRFYPKNRLRIGADFWGIGDLEGPIFTAPSSQAVLTVQCYLPFLYAKGEFKAPASIPDLKPDEIAIVVDGVVRMRGYYSGTLEQHLPLYYGSNPLGGSVVSDRFGGTILEISHTP